MREVGQKEWAAMTVVERNEFRAKVDKLAAQWKSRGLSTMAANCLANVHIETIEELSQIPDAELLRIRQLGRKCLAEIRGLTYPKDMIAEEGALSRIAAALERIAAALEAQP